MSVWSASHGAEGRASKGITCGAYTGVTKAQIGTSTVRVQEACSSVRYPGGVLHGSSAGSVCHWLPDVRLHVG
jgi:hypothetical protein